MTWFNEFLSENFIMDIRKQAIIKICNFLKLQGLDELIKISGMTESQLERLYDDKPFQFEAVARYAGFMKANGLIAKKRGRSVQQCFESEGITDYNELIQISYMVESLQTLTRWHETNTFLFLAIIEIVGRIKRGDIELNAALCCKMQGLSGLPELVDMSGKSNSTLCLWFNTQPFSFFALAHTAGRLKRGEIVLPQN